MTQPSEPDTEPTPLNSWRQRILHGSVLVSLVRGASAGRLGNTLRTAEDTLRRVVTNSFAYRWLTKEPDPEDIVIDLRETWTVGPFIRVLDRLLEGVQPYWQASTLKQVLDRVGGVGSRVADTRLGQLLVSLLEPPEPPAERSDSPQCGGKDEDTKNQAANTDEPKQQ